MPENEGWDSAGTDPGRAARRHRLTHALAKQRPSELGDLLRRPGSQMIRDGFSGWLALDCLRQTAGTDPWLTLVARQAEDATEAVGQTDRPVATVASTAAAPWLEAYAPPATLGLESQIGRQAVLDRLVAALRQLRQGTPLPEALTAGFGPQHGEALLAAPAMGDVVAGPGAPEARFWRWKQGGWVRTEHVPPVKVRHGAEPDGHAGPVGGGAPEGFLHLAAPSYERSPQDNEATD